MAQFITHEGTILEVHPKDGKKFSLEELQKFVGGYIEHLELGVVGAMADLFKGHHMFINEEGKLLGMLPNPKATTIARTAGIAATDWISGDALVVTPEEFQAMERDEEEEE